MSYKILGTTDEVTVCQCCGKSDLNKTAVIAVLDEDGNEESLSYFGVVCAAKHAGMLVSDVKKEISEINKEKKIADKKNKKLEKIKFIEDAVLNKLYPTPIDKTDTNRIISNIRKWIYNVFDSKKDAEKFCRTFNFNDLIWAMSK